MTKICLRIRRRISQNQSTINCFIIVLCLVWIIGISIYGISKLASRPRHAHKRTLAELGQIVQAELTELQTNSDFCDGPTILCGHNDLKCGLACQIHARAACVALSYGMGVPLIHTDTVGWPYRKPWKSAFKGPGSSCRPSSETINISWDLEKRPNLSVPQQLPYSLQNGFSVPKRIASEVAELTDSSFLWWMGQFVKFTVQLTREQAKLVDEAKQSIGLDDGQGHPTVGIHVRRPDKITEYNDSRHTTEEYFKAAEKLISKFEKRVADAGDFQSIFLASDDHTVLQEALESFPDKPIIGFVGDRTHHDSAEWVDELDEAIQDFFILSESDFLVCSLTSNICRVLLELMHTRSTARPSRKFKSMEGVYQYRIGSFVVPYKWNFI